MFEIIRGKMQTAQKIVLYGVEGIGKTTFAAQFPNPLFIDTEGGTKNFDVARLPAPSSWQMLLEEIQSVNLSICSTLVIDTVDWAEKLAYAHVCALKKWDSIESPSYGTGYRYAYEEMGKLLNLLTDVVNRGVNVILNAHAAMRKFEQPDEMGSYDRWELKLQTSAKCNTASMVKEWADMVLFANYKTMAVATDDKGKKFKARGGRRVMYTTHHPCWDAKNRFGLPEEIPLDFAPLAHLFQNSAPAPVPVVAEPAAPPVDPAPVETNDDPVQTDLLAETANTTAQTDLLTPSMNGSSDALSALRDLMNQNGIFDHEIQAAVAAKGYFPEKTPLENLPADFVRGVLLGAWPQVHGWIKENKPLPF